MTDDEMVRWHHQLSGYEYELTPGDGEGQGGLVCCSPWGHKELDTDWVTEQQPPPPEPQNVTCLIVGSL